MHVCVCAGTSRGTLSSVSLIALATAVVAIILPDGIGLVRLWRLA